MKPDLCLETPRAARVVEVIETRAVRGHGTEDDLIREVAQYWSRAGEMLAENDPCPNRRQMLFDELGEIVELALERTIIASVAPGRSVRDCIRDFWMELGVRLPEERHP
jgi:hypothetical protein